MLIQPGQKGNLMEIEPGEADWAVGINVLKADFFIADLPSYKTKQGKKGDGLPCLNYGIKKRMKHSGA